MNLRHTSCLGFSLVEILVGMLVLAVSITGSFEALRLSELKARHSRIDNRVTELIRENSDYLMYVAYDLLPEDGTVLSQGHLYQLYDSSSQSRKDFYQYTVTANVQSLNLGAPSEVRNITFSMTYQRDADTPSYQTQAQTIVSDVISRRKP